MKLLENATVFVTLYLLLMGPTYILPYLGSNSAVVNAAAASAGVGMNPAFWVHLLCLIALIAMTRYRGIIVDKKWLPIFPVLATVFDFAPLLSMIPLVPTVMHLLAIILGVAGTKAVASAAAR